MSETKTVQSKMTCANCGENAWENVDKYRIKPQGMCICTSCGFISYPSKYATMDEIKAHYRTGYRPPPNHNNLFAGERKNNFHHAFLHSLFEEWKKNGVTRPRILEIGAAYGMTLNWVRSLFPEAELYGTELTTSFRRNAMHEFGIKLDEDIDESKRYDLIISYKVLEHQLSPDVELARYARLLTPEGRLYISVPTWFNSLYNFGMSGFDLEYYFDPNHINVWTIEMFENMARRAGFHFEKVDQVIYASTYLMKADGITTAPVLRLNVDKIKEALAKIQLVYVMLQENRFDEAINVWRDCPQVWASYAEMNRKLLTEKGWPWFKENVLEAAMKSCPTSAEMVVMACDFAMRANQFEDAIRYAEESLKMKPENPASLHMLTNIMREMAMRGQDEKTKLHYFQQAREVARHLRFVSTQHFREATDLIYLFNSKIPFKGERAVTQKQMEKMVDNAVAEIKKQDASNVVPLTPSGSAVRSSPSPQEVSP